jgi:seryl-tRNA synthetase
MLDIRLFREQPDFVKAGLEKAGVDPDVVDTIRSLDDLVRSLKTSAETMKAELNAANKALGPLRKTLSEAEWDAKRSELRAVGDKINEADAERSLKETELQNLLLEIPNLPHEKVPIGKDDRDNVVARTWGEPRTFDFKPKPHWELGEALGILDLERGVKISGSRFYVLKRQGAALQRALISWMLDLHIEDHGYTEVYPPFVVKQECLYGTGNLPKFADNLYHDVEEDFWLVPTAEVPVTNLHRDEILTGAELPKRYVAYTPCFRREKMSAGRDVRGIKRGHQFDKVEMVKLTLPEESDAELDTLLDNAEDIIRRLNIPYRVVQVCTGDKTFSSAITYDLEIYAPASKGEEGAEWLEVSSCSNFRDFQARRANLRFRREAGSKPEFVHTLNGSGLALPRLMIAIMENFQNEDGSITIPEVLRPYMHNRDKIVAAV